MSKWVPLAVVFGVALLSRLALAQTGQPYAGFEARTIKSLSAEQIADLKAGRGMGLALAAELNGYPGPAHVLELAAQLGLTNGQKAEVQQQFNSMHSQAVALGDKLIAAEAELDRLFAERLVSEASLADEVRKVAVLQGELRTTHLNYHLAMARILTPDQMARYAELRGYAAHPNMPGMHQHQH